MKIRCLIADDNPENLAYLKAMCASFPELEIVAAFTNGNDLFAQQDAIAYDACFLDIDMPGFDGIELANLLADKPVIFVSARTDRAIETYDVDAVDFIPKPIKRTRFEKAVQRLINQVAAPQLTTESPTRMALFPTAQGKMMINFGDIVAIQSGECINADPRDKCMVMMSGEQIHLKNLTIARLLEDYLGASDFVQIERSTLLNLHASYTIVDRDTLQISLGPTQRLELRIGRRYESDFRERISHR
ncbi:MAG: LytTR family DNA-binding domain-containing protein [Bacteroidota bacterium]